MALPTDKEIDKVLDECNEKDYEGMSYADGVKAGIEWVKGYTEDRPFDED